MGKLSFSELEQISQQSQNNNDSKREKFFSLVNDQDTALVRILHTSEQNFDMCMVHDVQVDGKRKRVNCLRTANEPTANCPLCAAGVKPLTRIYIHMLQYVVNADGTLATEHVVFDRGFAYAKTLKNLVVDYCQERPLYDHIFKITRMGAKGSKDTQYVFNIQPQFNTQTHPYTQEDLEFTEVLGTIVWDKKVDELHEFLQTGKFPTRGDSNQGSYNQQAPQQTYGQAPNNYNQAPVQQSYTAPPNYNQAPSQMAQPQDNPYTQQAAQQNYGAVPNQGYDPSQPAIRKRV